MTDWSSSTKAIIMDNSCYTCRRRRIECEMTEPPCKKCKKAGLECFQKRPFRWVQGAAFRSKKKVSSVKDASVSVTKFNLDSTRRDASTNAKLKANDDASLEYGEDTPGEILSSVEMWEVITDIYIFN